MSIKIMMTPEVIDSVAAALVTRQVLREIVRSSVRSEFDRHYFVVTFHKGVSEDLPQMRLEDIAKVLCCPISTVRASIAEHIVYGSAKGGCEFCERASKKLKTQILAEQNPRRSLRKKYGLITLASLAPPRKQPHRPAKARSRRTRGLHKLARN